MYRKRVLKIIDDGLMIFDLINADIDVLFAFSKNPKDGHVM
jgi:hypothetical protein